MGGGHRGEAEQGSETKQCREWLLKGSTCKSWSGANERAHRVLTFRRITAQVSKKWSWLKPHGCKS